MTSDSRRRAYRKGQWAEKLAVCWFFLQGYQTLARGYRTAAGEIDLVVKRGRLLVFVEVKARNDLESAQNAIQSRQRQRIEKAAEIFLQRHKSLSDCDCRFDALLIAPNRWPRHIRDAWRESRH